MNKILLILKNITGRMGSAGGRHILTFISGLVTAAVGFGVIEQSDAVNLTDALQKFFDAFYALTAALTTFLGASATLVALITGIWASFKASPISQADAVAKKGALVITTPEIANASSSPNVISSSSVEVKTK